MRYEDWIRYEQARLNSRRRAARLRLAVLRLSQPPRQPQRPPFRRRVIRFLHR